jgi:hypothetical protein
MKLAPIDTLTSHQYTTQFKDCDVVQTEKIVNAIHQKYIPTAQLGTNAFSDLRAEISSLEASLESDSTVDTSDKIYSSLLRHRGTLEMLRRAKLTIHYASAHFTDLHEHPIDFTRLDSLKAGLGKEAKDRFDTISRLKDSIVIIETLFTQEYDRLATLFEECVEKFITKYNEDKDEPIGSFQIVTYARAGARAITGKACTTHLGTNFWSIPMPEKYTQMSTEDPLVIPKNLRELDALHFELLGLIYKIDEKSDLYAILSQKIKQVETAILFQHRATTLDSGDYPTELNHLVALEGEMKSIFERYKSKKAECVQYANNIHFLSLLLENKQPPETQMAEMQIALLEMQKLPKFPEQFKALIASRLKKPAK